VSLGARRILAAAVAVAAAACGQKGPPLAPLRVVPARVEDLAARRLGSDVYLPFTVPSKNVDGSTPADVDRIEVYGLTSRPGAQPGLPRTEELWRKEAALIGVVEVQPPPPPPAEEGEPAPPVPAPGAPPDPRPVQGALTHVAEHLAAQGGTEPPLGEEAAATPVEEERLEPWIPALWPSSAATPARSYVAIGFNRRGQPGQMSAVVAVPLVEPAPPPGTAPTIEYTEKTLAVAWQAPTSVQRPIQEPPATGMLSSTPLVPAPPALTYNVYELGASEPAGEASGMPTPANPTPLAVTTITREGVTFGVERCFEIRTVQTIGRAILESEPSPRACVTPVDTFPPAAPTSLAAVGSEGAISLIWERSPGADVAGYLVLRGEAPGATLQPVTLAPITETTYRDADVVPGVRYVYAVAAVDAADPPNRSPESNRVEDAAR
jgi:hypothetical protein